MTVVQLPTSDTTLALSKDGMFETIQGEGPFLGRHTTFLRLAGCNLTCTWCDTSYTWDWERYNIKEEVKTVSVLTLAEMIIEARITNLTITGGEPLLQANRLDKLFKVLRDLAPMDLDYIQFETNGTVAPNWSVLPASNPFIYVVSPKLKNSGNRPISEADIMAMRILVYRGLNLPSPHTYFKFVCESVDDFDEIVALLSRIDRRLIFSDKIYIMPQGVDPGTLTRRARDMVDEVIKRGWNLTTRFHMYLWDNERAK